MKVNTVIRLRATPFASARPRSGPIRNCIRHSARKPITVVRPLDRMEVVDMVSASTIASFGSVVVWRHSAKRCSRNTE